jgi:RecA/RadA recombinase
LEWQEDRTVARSCQEVGSGITNVELEGSGARECLLETVAEAVCSLKEKWQRLSVGCSKLDGFLRGGVAVQGITEIAGESSSGKTQLCLQMALTVQYPVIYGGLNGGWCFLLPFCQI